MHKLSFVYFFCASLTNRRVIKKDRIRSRHHRLLQLGLFIVFALSVEVCRAATYYVAKNGNDSSPGTEAQPFGTIRKGVSVLVAGDTLYIMNGTYSETIDGNSMTVRSGTSWSTPIRIANYPGNVVIMNGSGSAIFNLAQSYIQYLIIDGITMDSTSVGNGVSIVNGANHIRLQNCEIKNARLLGIQVGGSSTTSTHNEFLNLDVHHNGYQNNPLGHGIYLQTSYNLVDGGKWHHNAYYGIQSYNGYGHSIYDNIIRNAGVYSNDGGGITINMAMNTLVANNLVYGNIARGGINVSYGASSGTRVLNNTVYNNPADAGIQIFSGVTNTIIKNNIVYQNGGGIVDAGSGTVKSNNLLIDPKFLNAGSNDLHLQPTSPAVDTGIALSEVPDDHDRIARPKGSTYDIGAYEYQSSQSQASAPANLRIVSP